MGKATCKHAQPGESTVPAPGFPALICSALNNNNDNKISEVLMIFSGKTQSASEQESLGHKTAVAILKLYLIVLFDAEQELAVLNRAACTQMERNFSGWYGYKTSGLFQRWKKKMLMQTLSIQVIYP